MHTKPQLNADPRVLIDWFDDFNGPNDYAFLSNFYLGRPLVYRGSAFATGEHLFAALKADRHLDYHRVRKALGPDQAKALGRMIKLRPDWESIKYDVMRLVLSLKFAPGREEADLLVKTGHAQLVEGTYWHDQVWGVDLTREDRPGRNWLGTLLMAQRARLQALEAATGPEGAALAAAYRREHESLSRYL